MGKCAILALDPDIPPRLQRVHFEIAPGNEGHIPGAGRDHARQHRVRVVTRGGKHRLMLFDHSGEVLDELSFEVRGALRQYPREGK